MSGALPETPLAAIRAILSTTPARLSALIESVPREILRQQPSEGEWSAHRTIVHLWTTERDVFPVRVRSFLAGERLGSFNRSVEDEMVNSSVHVVLDGWTAERSNNLRLLDSIDMDDLRRESTHPDLGPVTLSELLHEWAGHDLQHLVQIEQAIMQPFIRGCGAWRIYFTAHDTDVT